MDDKVYTVEEIEAFCLGSLPADQQLTFEQRLESDELFRRRVRLVQSILDGFVALASEQLEERMAGWASTLQEQEDAELIEWYLSDELGPTAKKYVEERRLTDATFDTLFQSQQEIFAGLEAAQADDFASKLATWEKETQAETPVRPLNLWIKRFSIAASIALVLSLGGWGYMKNQYSNQKLFAALYQSPNIGSTMGGQGLDGFKERFSTAHRSLQAKQFDKATQEFIALSTALEALDLDPLAKSYYNDNLEWSLLLARLGNDDIGNDFDVKLEQMAKDQNHEYRTQAQTLRTQLNSFWR
ncbi:MAG: hypothetical protein HRU41_27380 [Saprospiraceae bacterium]|nr:hypothetical protein [Saprospiraceae bacterium]